MANDDGSIDLPEWFGSIESQLFVNTFSDFPEIVDNPFTQVLFHEALFDYDLTAAERELNYNAMVDYLMDEYDIDFEDVFDWEAYREWYG